MRTTLDVDDDVLLAVKERARREKRTAGAVLSDLAREALNAGVAGFTPELRPEFGFRPLPSRGGVVSNALVDDLREELGA
ncbi:MAG: antitoxin [Propionibacteriales bacterium]|nr:antitoxin [Propionibacteriales bacterium]